MKCYVLLILNWQIYPYVRTEQRVLQRVNQKVLRPYVTVTQGTKSYEEKHENIDMDF